MLIIIDHKILLLLPIKEVAGVYKFIGFQGLASHGGTIGVVIAILFYCKKYKFKLLNVLDKVALVAPITAAFIRLGNFMNSEIYDKPTNGNWGVVFQRDDIIPRHPTQLYEAFSYLIIFGILILVYKNQSKNPKDGFILGLFLVLLFLTRFVIEFFKENKVAFENTMALNMGQLLSIPFITMGLILIIYSKSLRKPILEYYHLLIHNNTSKIYYFSTSILSIK